MKYIIDIPDDRIGDFVGSTHLLMPYTMAGHKGHHDTGLKLTSYTEPDRKAIEDEVWNFVDFMIHEMDIEEREECFGEPLYAVCIHELTYQGAKAEYDEWKKQKDETLDTGDEVYDNEIDSKGVILRRYNSDTIDILWDDGSAGETIAIKAITKTGRHFPEVAELLEKMRGEQK